MTSNIIDLPELREQTHVFQNRTHAGQVLARMIEAGDKPEGIILAIPAGGVPVGVTMAEKLELDFDVAVVSKITLPWNTEAGYGAVAFDGTVKLNQDLMGRVNLTKEDIEKGIEKTTAKVVRRVTTLRGTTPFPDLGNRSVILVDDGLASGFTMETAVASGPAGSSLRFQPVIFNPWKGSPVRSKYCIVPISAAASAMPWPAPIVDGRMSLKKIWQKS